MTPNPARPNSQDENRVLIELLLPADSPRLHGEDGAHVERLAQCADYEMPPILVHRGSMRVIDGMHRLRAATIRGKSTIAVEFFDGSDEDAFIRSVQLNVTHGLPLTLFDRKAAALRIVQGRPEMSDRAIASICGLSGKTIAAIRQHGTEDGLQLGRRVGHDGRMRPVGDASKGRIIAAKLFSEFPESSLREVATSAGISLGTARDVRMRLQRGEEPVGYKRRDKEHDKSSPSLQDEDITKPRGRSVPGIYKDDYKIRNEDIISKLGRDPSIRLTEGGRTMIRWLHRHVFDRGSWNEFIDSLPPHCIPVIAELARKMERSWHELVGQLEERNQRNQVD